MTLYEITGELRELQNMIEEGADPDVVNDTIESVEFDLEQKAEGYVMVIRNLEAQAKAIKDEEKRLREKRLAAENGIESLKKRLFDSMNATGKKKLNAGVFTLSVQKNGGALPVIIDADCVENMPKEMLKIDIKPDTKKIAELLQDEEKSRLYSKFAHFGERGESLRIR